MVAKLRGELGPPKGLASLGDILMCKVKVVELTVPALEVCMQENVAASSGDCQVCGSVGRVLCTDCTARNQYVEPPSDVSYINGMQEVQTRVSTGNTEYTRFPLECRLPCCPEGR